MSKRKRPQGRHRPCQDCKLKCKQICLKDLYLRSVDLDLDQLRAVFAPQPPPRSFLTTFTESLASRLAASIAALVAFLANWCRPFVTHVMTALLAAFIASVAFGFTLKPDSANPKTQREPPAVLHKDKTVSHKR
jgi:hypothetical protein